MGTGRRTLCLPTPNRWAVACITNVAHCNIQDCDTDGLGTLESVAVLEPDDMFVPIVVCECLAEADVKGIVKTDTGSHSYF
jgi:hypothetical protein